MENMENKLYIEESGFIDINAFDRIKKRYMKKSLILNINGDKLHDDKSLSSQIHRVIIYITQRYNATIVEAVLGQHNDDFVLNRFKLLIKYEII